MEKIPETTGILNKEYKDRWVRRLVNPGFTMKEYEVWKAERKYDEHRPIK